MAFFSETPPMPELLEVGPETPVIDNPVVRKIFILAEQLAELAGQLAEIEDEMLRRQFLTFLQRRVDTLKEHVDAEIQHSTNRILEPTCL
jgi:hypothetical protein